MKIKQLAGAFIVLFFIAQGAVVAQASGSGQRVSDGVMDEERENCLQAGMDAFLPKPVEATALRAIIERFGIKK